MKHILTFIFLLFSVIIFGQKYQVLYEYNWVKYDCRPQEIYNGNCVLNIVDGQSIYYDAAIKVNSEVVNTPKGYKLVGGRPVFKYFIRKSQDSDSLLFAEGLPLGKYMYKDQLPNLNWIIEDETMEIKGYTCQKALGHFMGRDFLAWFTNEIPVGNGPDRFGGLPGLILKLEDANNKISYNMVSLRKLDTLDTSFNSQTYKMVSREKFKAVEADYYLNFKKYAGRAFNNSNYFEIRGKQVTVEELFDDIKQDFLCRNNID